MLLKDNPNTGEVNKEKLDTSDYSGLVDDIFSFAEDEKGKATEADDIQISLDEEPGDEEKPPIITKKLKKERKPFSLFKKREKKEKIKVFTPQRETSNITADDEDDSDMKIVSPKKTDDPLFPEEAFTDRKRETYKEESQEAAPLFAELEDIDSEDEEESGSVFSELDEILPDEKEESTSVFSELDEILPDEKEKSTSVFSELDEILPDEKEESTSVFSELDEILTDDMQAAETVPTEEAEAPIEEACEDEAVDEAPIEEAHEEETVEEDSEEDSEALEELGLLDGTEEEKPKAEGSEFSVLTTQLTEEHHVESIAEDELDDTILLALGYKNADGEVRERKPEEEAEEKVFALEKEYRSSGEAPIINEKFTRQKSLVEKRIILTAICSALLLMYTGIASLLKGSFQIFDTERFFGSNVLIALELLLIASLFSSRELLSGLKSAFTRKPDVYAPTALLVVFTSVAAVAYAFLAKEHAGLSPTLYMFFASLTLFVPLSDDYRKITSERRAFGILSSENPTRLDVVNGEYIIRRGSYASDFRTRFRRGNTKDRTLAIAMWPVLALSLIMGMVSYFIKKDAGEAILTSIRFASISFPSVLLFSSYPFYAVLDRLTRRSGTAVIGHETLRELSELDSVSVADTSVFDNSAATPVNMELYGGADIFRVIYCTASALKGRDCALAKIFEKNAEELELSDDRRVIEDTENGIGAIIDNKYAVIIGNSYFLEEHELTAPYVPEDDVSSAPAFIAINGTVMAYISVDYSVTSFFKEFADAARHERIKLRIYSEDFCISEAMLAEKLHMDMGEFELVKGKLPRPEGNVSTAAVAESKAYSLFALPHLARSVLDTERLTAKLASFLFAVSVLLAIGLSAFGLAISEWAIILCNAILAAAVILLPILSVGSGND